MSAVKNNHHTSDRAEKCEITPEQLAEIIAKARRDRDLDGSKLLESIL